MLSPTTGRWPQRDTRDEPDVLPLRQLHAVHSMVTQFGQIDFIVLGVIDPLFIFDLDDLAGNVMRIPARRPEVEPDIILVVAFNHPAKKVPPRTGTSKDPPAVRFVHYERRPMNGAFRRGCECIVPSIVGHSGPAESIQRCGHVDNITIDPHYPDELVVLAEPQCVCPRKTSGFGHFNLGQAGASNG